MTGQILITYTVIWALRMRYQRWCPVVWSHGLEMGKMSILGLT